MGLQIQEKYKSIVLDESNESALTILHTKLTEDNDVSAVNTDILIQQILNQIEPLYDQLKITTQTQPQLIADILSGIP